MTPRDEQLDLVEQIAALALKLDELCLKYGPLMPGYCDECGGSDCCDWECQAVRQLIPYSVESAAGIAEMER